LETIVEVFVRSVDQMSRHRALEEALGVLLQVTPDQDLREREHPDPRFLEDLPAALGEDLLTEALENVGDVESAAVVGGWVDPFHTYAMRLFQVAEQRDVDPRLFGPSFEHNALGGGLAPERHGNEHHRRQPDLLALVRLEELEHADGQIEV